MIYKILSSSEQLSGTPSTISDANRVLIQHNAGDTTPVPHLITVKSDAGAAPEGAGVAVVGTFWVHPGQDIVIEKYKLYTIEVDSGTEVYATYVGVTG